MIGSYSVSLTGHPPQVPGVPCGLLASYEWITTFWTTFLIFDTVTFTCVGSLINIILIEVNLCIFRLTAWKIVEYWRKGVDTSLIRLIWRYGLIYFASIVWCSFLFTRVPVAPLTDFCSVNCINVVIVSQASPPLRPSNLQ